MGLIEITGYFGILIFLIYTKTVNLKICSNTFYGQHFTDRHKLLEIIQSKAD